MGLKDLFGGSEERRIAVPVDKTPAEFRRLRGPLSQAFTSMLEGSPKPRPRHSPASAPKAARARISSNKPSRGGFCRDRRAQIRISTRQFERRKGRRLKG